MINPLTKLNVWFNSTDHSNDAHDFSKDAFSLTFTDEDFLYIGFYKPINTVYVALATAQQTATTLSCEYWDGSNWASLSNLYDDTKGFTRSGFITWDRSQSNQAASTVNSLTLFWVRIATSNTMGALSVQGINFLFADDNDLVPEVPEIKDTNHLAGKTSHLLTHVAARQQLVQDLNNKNHFKLNPTTGLKEDLTCWDLLDVNQVKQAAIFLALAKIYFNFSDSPDDKHYQKYQDYMARYKDAYELARLALDTDDDGVADEEETQKEEFSILRITR